MGTPSELPGQSVSSALAVIVLDRCVLNGMSANSGRKPLEAKPPGHAACPSRKLSAGKHSSPGTRLHPSAASSSHTAPATGTSDLQSC